MTGEKIKHVEELKVGQFWMENIGNKLKLLPREEVEFRAEK